MERQKVTYFSYITVTETLPSILQRGVLSFERAQRIPHRSIALDDVQARREARVLRNGRALHSYANVYFWARNAMMYSRRHLDDICVVRISSDILDIDGAYYTTRNAGAGDCDFHPFLGAFDHLDEAEIYVRGWEGRDERQKMQAEVLIPDVIPPQYLECVYVRSERHRQLARQLAAPLDVRVYPGLFFEQ
jgi:hypothetical protein